MYTTVSIRHDSHISGSIDIYYDEKNLAKDLHCG